MNTQKHTTAVTVLAAAILTGLPPDSHAASCAGVENAIEAGMKQARIYAASFEQLPDGKPGKAFLSTITIDNTHYLFEGTRGFGATQIESAEMRNMGSGLIGFSPGATCTAQGSVTIAGKAAQKFSYTTDLGNGPANITLWIDNATGLPIRGITDEPAVDVDVQFTKDGGMKTIKKPTGKRSRHVSGFLYGAVVTAPMKNGVDAGMQAAMQALVK